MLPYKKHIKCFLSLSAMLKIVFNVKFIYRSASIPDKTEYFLDFSLKVTVAQVILIIQAWELLFWQLL